MPGKIHVLPSELVDQIAAGEVVERPASVVKELVENSLDAGATRVVCQVEEGGRALVRVVDDGEGMSREDLALSVVRHATSKLRSLEELERVVSLGFRGEALPSIAAVSRLCIVTRRREDEVASRLDLAGGEPPRLSDAGAPVGTSVEVAELFFNVPARRKFLRTAATELAHVSTWLTRLGLARPGVHLRLEHNGRRVLEAEPSADPAQRAAALLGREVFEHLLPVAREDGGVRLRGLASDPNLSRNNAQGIHLFVNGRFVRDRLLQHAVMQGYRTVLPEGRYPVVVLALELEPGQVDVNVHPQKTEVRFLDTRAVQRAVTAALAARLAEASWLGAARGGPTRDYVLRAERPGQEPAAAEGAGGPAGVRAALGRFQASRAGRPQAGLRFSPPPPGPATPAPRALAGLCEPAPVDPAFEVDRPLREWDFVGTLWNTYLVLTAGDRLALVDQHAAHERITFERLRASLDSGEVRAQRLLVPVQLELDASAAAAAAEHAADLRSMGFELEPFGPRALSVRSVPALLGAAPVAALVRDVLDEFGDTGQGSAFAVHREAVLARMACHGSVRAGQALGEGEVRELLGQLERIDFAGTCPHGRPVLVELGRDEVAGWFLRS
ncbi:MAG TPA: DNA mismatch repair endonuclease MutL [Myxococcota bacterium]|nr:DNA mismatch repair endonuclease MutL [Myxococcota bacterium]HRY96136.1 DNA mismatch repair endonuclease MutL [Myxococcota bacterium]HSA23763.1 DNA mismatch repair endonuclease MutL [Myxococcota bacterium]